MRFRYWGVGILKNRLIDYKSNVYSQNGEDGILAELLTRLDIDNKSERWCVEFGAWDGMHLSNTFRLVSEYEWNAIYVESELLRYRDLEASAKNHTKIHPVHGMVGGSQSSGILLDDVLAETQIPINYDLLSIDIDSSDLDAWVSHVNYRPTIVVIEINSSIPPGILQWHGEAKPFGNSFSSTMLVATAKKYTLVCHTGNLIFVKNEVIDQVSMGDFDRYFPERLFLWKWAGNPASNRISFLRAWINKVPEQLKNQRKTLRKRLNRAGFPGD